MGVTYMANTLLSHHGAESEPENFKCKKCNFISNKKNTMNKHNNTKHTPDVSQNKCSLCKDIFRYEMEYKKAY